MKVTPIQPFNNGACFSTQSKPLYQDNTMSLTPNQATKILFSNKARHISEACIDMLQMIEEGLYKGNINLMPGDRRWICEILFFPESL